MRRVIKGKIWSGYIGECKKDKRGPCFLIQEEPDDEWDDAIFLCDILRKFARQKVVITIKPQEATKMEAWKKWARNNKAEVKEIADKYSGSFVKALVDAFIRADAVNTEKILDTWPGYFQGLYHSRRG